MSRKLFAFLLSELSVVRIICKRCGGVVETPLSKLHERFHGSPPSCHICRQALTRPASFQSDNPFVCLAYAVDTLNKANSDFDVEFVLPDTTA